jgi:hypothetical protein
MTIPGSSIPAVRRYLFDQLTAQLTTDPAFPKAQLLVVYDQPGPFQPDDIVSIGKVSRQVAVSSLVGSGGAGWLEERFQVEVIVDVFRGGDYAQAAFERAVALVDAVCAVVRGDPSLGGCVLEARPAGSTYDSEWDDEHKGRHCVGTIEVDCYQRI